MDKELQELAKKLLLEKKVDWVIGYEKAYADSVTRPVFINKPEDVNKLVINKFCVNNLAVYLPKFKKSKVAIVLKGCDMASYRELIKEHQIPKENIIKIGIACEGVSAKNEKTVVSIKCDCCNEKMPKNTDHMIGSVKEAPAKPKDFKDIEAYEKMSAKEKEAFWLKEFDKCIRCYACRNVCPVCYCPDCFAQRNLPEYLNKEVTPMENRTFHMIRTQHVFGRCTDCKACSAACPVGIPLHLITKKSAKDALELFNYVSGADEETRPPLSTFKIDDKIEGML